MWSSARSIAFLACLAAGLPVAAAGAQPLASRSEAVTIDWSVLDALGSAPAAVRAPAPSPTLARVSAAPRPAVATAAGGAVLIDWSVLDTLGPAPPVTVAARTNPHVHVAKVAAVKHAKRHHVFRHHRIVHAKRKGGLRFVAFLKRTPQVALVPPASPMEVRASGGDRIDW